MRPLRIPSRYGLVSHIFQRAYTPSIVSRFHRTTKHSSRAPSDFLSTDAKPGWRSFTRRTGDGGKTSSEDASRGEVSAQAKHGRKNANRLFRHFLTNPPGRVNASMLAVRIGRLSTSNQVRKNHTSGIPQSMTSETENSTSESPARVTRTDEESVEAEKKVPVPSPGLLAGKRCLVTGASRGIGKAIAKRFADEGARCVLVGRKGETLLSVVQELKGYEASTQEKDLSKGHRVVEGDVGDVQFWEGFRKESNIDILVNCAGVAHYSPLVATSSTSIEKTVQTNLLGTMLGCRMVGRNMMKKRAGECPPARKSSFESSTWADEKAGCIINVASLLGLKGGKGSAAYAASKAGVIALTRALAAELGEKNVRVNVIVPGYVETSMTRAMTPDAHSAAVNAIPLKRFGLPAEVADAAVFLATNQYASNCVLNLDGGLSAT
ncbi:3-oxoacyl-[acyl-carrier-protein] reductase [Lachnellula occidentalis]|uniref:3-oxoacyl-[acyl-carrier-protein] reductase n=1 Tax=Lachnellula occidentalis TaxID=215460 RepID=A0A8H8S9J6_9HELO|nr:3-oxoacyl-[acyl-carrier-protein] reductase [Lachnellula occidentalis]